MRALNHFRCFRFGLLLLILLGLHAITRAQTPDEDKATRENRKGSITGRVVNQSGQPLANTMVILRSYGQAEGGMAFTDVEGNFKVTGLAPAAYLISVYAATYVPVPRDPDVNPIGYYHIGDSARIEMMKGGVITGTVRRANGEPVVSVAIRAFMVRDGKGQPSRFADPVSQGQTDDRGVYRLYGLAPGTYVIATEGTYASGYGIQPYEGDAPTYAPSSTRDTAAEVTVNAGEEAANIDIRYRDDRGHAVSGRVTAANSVDPSRGFNVTLLSVLNGTEEASYVFYQSPDLGGFMFTGVADGEYNVFAAGYSPTNDTSISEVRHIKVSGADITGIDLAVKPLASISGAVRLEDSKAAECQGKLRPVMDEVVVSTYHNEKTAPKELPQSVWDAGRPVTPDKQGSFLLRNLAAGQYRFVTRPLAKYWYLKSISWPPGAKAAQINQPLDAAKDWTTIKTGDKYSGLIITFAAGAASIEGRIEPRADQKTWSRLFVYLTPVEAEKREDVLRYFVSLAGDDGSFRVSNVPPGRYWIVAKAAAENDTNMLSKLRLPDGNELRARILRESETGKTETELKPCQNVTDYRLALLPR